MFKSRSLILVPILALTACGGKSHKSGGVTPSVQSATPDTTTPPATANPTPVVSSVSGDYEMTIQNLNSLYFSVKGSGSMILNDSHLTVNVKMTHAPRLRSMYQRMYSGECPTLQDDKNGDGIIDMKEAEEKLGKMLIPLDSDINSSRDIKNVFPQASILGKYSYTSKGNIDVILKDLISKGYTDNLDLESSVILFQGLPTYYKFPNSIESADGLPVSETLPVACATIKRISK